MDSAEQNGTTIPAQLTVDDVDVEFLPLIYEIIRSVERDPHDTSQKTRESQDTSQKVLELQKKLEQARSQIRRLPGVEYSKEEQLQKLETLRKQLQLKKDLLLKYRHMCIIIDRFRPPEMVFRYLFHRLINNPQLVNKLADSYPIRRAAQLVVYAYTVGFQGIVGKITPARLQSFTRKLQIELERAKKELEEANEKLKKR
ncbi:hypothetical protein L9F63_013276 [Diploptera punctata]|uniref:Mediator of RNA polymerase II transcription subunit 9 n=2 Tax=Diploptera punctata TaxID=6984 RepID=A0AAD8EME8_DIPPU|nr:hypothetical protein L9F63_013276 [Diploptera punctata]